MRLATASQSRKIDEMAQMAAGLSSEILMEGAGAQTAHVISQAFLPELRTSRVLVLCGPGSNGGDGYVVARFLTAAGYRCDCVDVSFGIPQSHLNLEQKKRAQLSGVSLYASGDFTFEGVGLVVDAVFGTGLSKPIYLEILGMIEQVRRLKIPVVSLDVPSGLHADTGDLLGDAFSAAMTITFGVPKPGFYIRNGPSRVGRLRVLAPFRSFFQQLPP